MTKTDFTSKISQLPVRHAEPNVLYSILMDLTNSNININSTVTQNKDNNIILNTKYGRIHVQNPNGTSFQNCKNGDNVQLNLEYKDNTIVITPIAINGAKCYKSSNITLDVHNKIESNDNAVLITLGNTNIVSEKINGHITHVNINSPPTATNSIFTKMLKELPSNGVGVPVNVSIGPENQQLLLNQLQCIIMDDGTTIVTNLFTIQTNARLPTGRATLTMNEICGINPVINENTDKFLSLLSHLLLYENGLTINPENITQKTEQHELLSNYFHQFIDNISPQTHDQAKSVIFALPIHMQDSSEEVLFERHEANGRTHITFKFNVYDTQVNGLALLTNDGKIDKLDLSVLSLNKLNKSAEQEILNIHQKSAANGNVRFT